MTTILLLSLAIVLFFTMWVSALFRLRYWCRRALYAEALERTRAYPRAIFSQQVPIAKQGISKEDV